MNLLPSMLTNQQQTTDNSSTTQQICLLGQSLEELQQLCAKEGFPKYTARQLCDWIYNKRVSDFDAMSNISIKTRCRLKEIASVGRRAPVGVQRSADGTCKFLFPVTDTVKPLEPNNHIRTVESVFIPDGDRNTLCVSSQCGCKMGCRFCVTGQQGFHGNLTAAGILNQLFGVEESAESISNIVFMGMGEPLDNYDAVKRAVQVLTSDWGLGWSPHRITVSTVGITPMLKRLLDECQCHVAVSLHNPFADERAEIMPMQKVYPITEIVSLLKRYNWRGQRRISFEYTMIKGINESTLYAAELVRLLRGLHCRVNLIRYHSSPNSPYQACSQETMTAFRDYLSNHGITCTIRASRGEDIMAACGQLATSKISK